MILCLTSKSFKKFRHFCINHVETDQALFEKNQENLSIYAIFAQFCSGAATIILEKKMQYFEFTTLARDRIGAIEDTGHRYG